MLSPVYNLTLNICTHFVRELMAQIRLRQNFRLKTF